MNLYKVEFDKSRGVSSEQLFLPHPGTVRLERVNGMRKIKWLTIYQTLNKKALERQIEWLKASFSF